MPAGSSERIAEDALRRALLERCGGGSWEGFARGVAWEAFAGGARSRPVDALADAAAAMLEALVDEALWAVERVALDAWYEFLELRPGDVDGALAAARLDAAEESERLVESARARVLAALFGDVRPAA